MIRKGTVLHVIDNSGASLLKCIHVCGKNKISVGFPGTVVVVSVLRLRRAIPKKLVSKAKICFAVVTAIAHPIARLNGVTVKGVLSTAVILGKYNKKGFAKNKPGDAPLANRLTGSVYEEVRRFGFFKVIALARGVI